MLLVIPLSTALTIIVTVALSICGGIAILLQTFLKDLYDRIDRANQKLIAIDGRIDDLVLNLTKQIGEVKTELNIVPVKEEAIIEKLNDLKKQNERVVDIFAKFVIDKQPPKS